MTRQRLTELLVSDDRPGACAVLAIMEAFDELREVVTAAEDFAGLYAQGFARHDIAVERSYGALRAAIAKAKEV